MSEESFYYKAGEQTSEKIRNFLAERQRIADIRTEAVKRLGGNGTVLETRFSVVGLQFDTSPPAPWVLCDGYKDCYKPKGTTKAAREIRNAIQNLPMIPQSGKFAELMGSSSFGLNVRGNLFRTINLKQASGVFFIEVPECKQGREWVPPSDCVPVKLSEFYAAMEEAK